MADSFTKQLSAYLDEELDSASRNRLEAHLAGCAECAAVLADLRAIIAAAPHYTGREPGRDLWKSIESRLGEAEVVPIGTVRPPDRLTARPPARHFGWTALIAASLAMAAVGGGAVWLALRPSRTIEAPLVNQPAGPAAIQVAFADREFDAAVQDLEEVLAAGRGRLDTATVRLVEENLRKIDEALADARAAIQRDPANAYLNRQIAANMRLKLNLLRSAANAIASRT
jgi:putative zinc finger protein